MELRSVLASIDIAERSAYRLAGESGLGSDDADWLGLAVREAVANAVIHGNRLDPNLPVRLLLERDAHRIRVTIGDQGPGFTPEVAADREVNLTPSGRGLVLIAHCVDVMDVIRRTHPPGCDVVLVKHLPEGQPDTHEDHPSPAERRHHPRHGRQDHHWCG
ncbi:ATP-binding protein [Frankia sp. CNm7]|uniref:ATP-binding protein n=2 Tax=Frankia nepalensis TaxID=1836974 RepID=A0A937UR55_9ACTN|nr:ATP-binding protein [Frankia nepalensis]MBL7498114.1 ATP-binding protein [Frankia nepalensis]MBL7509271.1 ATP-binding protein [Frankia nepalensis]MBL7522744.1 ATP-binding protein [Frankia nepalensis]MBL7630808.1 ATP-binding protein [Frankia nepalensis]